MISLKISVTEPFLESDSTEKPLEQ